MAINLKGSDTSTYASPITLGSDAPASQGSTYYSTSVDIRRDDGGAVYNVFRNGNSLSNRTIILNSDGSATFAGGVNIDRPASIPSSARGIAVAQDGSITAEINLAGAATFAGNKFTISDKGNISRVGTGGNYYNLGAFNNSGTTSGATGGRLNLFTDDPDGTPDVQTIALNGLDGSALFGTTDTAPSANNVEGCAIGPGGKYISISRENDLCLELNYKGYAGPGVAFRLLNNGDGSNSVVEFGRDGSAKFAGEVSSPNACTAWVNFAGTTETIRTNFNFSTITRSSAGKYKAYFTTPMDTGDFCASVVSNQNGAFIDGQMTTIEG